MKRLAATLVLSAAVILATDSAAQGLDDSLAANEALPDANVAGIAFLDGQPAALLAVVKVNPKTFGGVFRASKTATSATEAGVSYRDFSAAVGPLLAESAIVAELAETDQERFLASAYSSAAKIYGAAGREWSISIRAGIDQTDYISTSFAIARKVLAAADAAYLRNLKAPPKTKKKTAATNRPETKSP